MSHSSLVRVNQKLSQAKFLIHVVRQQSNSLKPIELSSYLEAICFHLYSAYHFYLHEIAETYHLNIGQGIHNEDALIELFKHKNKYAVEAQELLELRKQPNSWLSQLYVAYQELWRQQQKESKSSLQETGIADSHLIQVVTIDEPKAELSSEVLEAWYNQLRKLVVRQRETSAEF